MQPWITAYLARPPTNHCHRRLKPHGPQDARLAALSATNADVQAALDAQHARVSQLATQLAARDGEVSRLSHALAESQEQTERAVEQVCSASMAAEQAAAAVAQDAEALRGAEVRLAAAAGLAAEVERLGAQLRHYSILKTKYVQKSAALKEVCVDGRGSKATFRVRLRCRRQPRVRVLVAGSYATAPGWKASHARSRRPTTRPRSVSRPRRPRAQS